MQLNRDMTMMPDMTYVQEKHQYGFTLLEVLIALLVLSIGLLGLAALQTTGLRSNQMATMRTLATEAAYDITDRMRANPAGVAAGEYVIALTDVTDPSATATAASDLNAWRELVLRLPGGESEITQCDTADGCDGLTHIITVYWNEARDVNAVGHNCPPLSDTDLRCFRLVYSE
jgi:type IV pilus assembly protein PilV